MSSDRNKYADRISALRGLMCENNWDAVIISGSDPHGSEYPAPRWKQVEWISGFTGEAGDIVVTKDHAGLWTDTRYFIQANKQLEGTGIELHKTRIPEQVLIPEWLATQAFPTKNIVNIAVDGLCQRVSDIQRIKAAFNEDREIRIIDVPDLLSKLWTDRPGIPGTTIFALEDKFAGESSDSKIEWLRLFIKSKGCDAILVCALDEIAWLLNIRANDIEYNPFAISYLIVSTDEVKWFVRDNYDDIAIALSEGSGRLFIDLNGINYHLYSILDKSAIVTGESPIALRKAVKNPTEIQGMKDIHITDGIAMEKFLFWLDRKLENGEEPDEWEASVKLGEFRSESSDYLGDSFATISAFGEGAALPHYCTPKFNAPKIRKDGLYLCDSGGQYYKGTTDITRTVPTGHCTQLEMEDYTLVLKGHIELEMAVFPKGTAGCQIDYAAREPLWKHFRNYGHGTGHGVGHCLGVHEGPQEIRQNFNSQALLAGMVVTDEPGIYREGQHGVRHENILLCKELQSNEFGTWMGFEPLTLCHIDTRPIIRDLLTREEIQWLNEYNLKVRKILSPLLPEETAEWLEEKTKAI